MNIYWMEIRENILCNRINVETKKKKPGLSRASNDYWNHVYKMMKFFQSNPIYNTHISEVVNKFTQNGHYSIADIPNAKYN